MIAGALAAAAPEPPTIRRTAQEIVQRPEYQLEPGEDHGLTLLGWLLDLFWWLMTPIRALFEALHAIWPPLAWLIIILLLVILVALVAHIVYTFKQALARRVPGRLDVGRDGAPPDPAALERQAREAASAGDYIGAVRLLFRASLVRLQQAERRPLRRGTTNRELLRRYQSSPIVEALRLFVEMIDRKWYGHETCTPTDYEECARAHEHIRRTAGELAHADRA